MDALPFVKSKISQLVVIAVLNLWNPTGNKPVVPLLYTRLR